MTQSIVVQVGQCGNQIGCRFWDLALREHAAVNKTAVYDEPISTYFRNVDDRKSPPRELPLGDGRGRIGALKARAVLVDMEEGVINAALKGPLGEVFDPVLKVSSVSGSGNNWAVGYYRYGVSHHDELLDAIRHAAEACDCLQSFMVLHSMGGGTGSGLGTSVLGMLRDEYPEVYRFVTAVFPSQDDDVVTSPYNSILALRQLTEHADCVLPVENDALAEICRKIDKGKQQQRGRSTTARAGSAVTDDVGGKKQLPWDAMNNIVAHTLLHLTSGSRFDGSLNVDVNEITMNLVPFPRLHYLISSLTPLYALSDVSQAPRKLDQMFSDISHVLTHFSLRHNPNRKLDQMFSDAFAPEFQLTKTAPRHGVFLACALMLRGDVEISDVRRNIERLRPSLTFVPWNREGWKTGLCATPPLNQTRSLLTLSNSTCIGASFAAIQDRFVKLYRSKAYVHHFTSEGMDASEFVAARQSCGDLVAEYARLEQEAFAPAEEKPPPRLRVV